MKTTLPLISTLGLISLVSCKQKEQKPNIILIMADDMGYECVDANGCGEYSTPNINALAENGVRFTHCYANPLSTPSRVGIMTGKYNYRNYLDFGYLDVKEKTFANILQDAGYKTCIAGKWQLNGLYYKDRYPACEDIARPYHFGFDEYCLWQLNKKRTKKGGERYAFPGIICNEKELSTDTNDYGPTIFTDFILDFINNNKANPFFVYYPMVLVHDPFCSTPDSKYWSDTVSRFVNDTTHFVDMVKYSDKMVGKIVAKLAELNLTEKTIIIFTGDNGTDKKVYTLMKDGSIIKGDKGEMTEHGTNVPLIVSYKNHYKKQETNVMVDFPDILPTLCDMANTALPDSFITDGKSFLPLLKGEAYQEDEFLYLYYNPKWGPWRTERQFIRNKQYKLYNTGEFFDLSNDIQEQDTITVKEMTKEQKEAYQKLEKELSKYPEIKYDENK